MNQEKKKREKELKKLDGEPAKTAVVDPEAEYEELPADEEHWPEEGEWGASEDEAWEDDEAWAVLEREQKRKRTS